MVNLIGKELLFADPLFQERMVVRKASEWHSEYNPKPQIRLECEVILHPEESHYAKYGKEKEDNDSIPYQRIIFNPPATIVYWKNGTRTVVKCDPNDKYDPMTGVLLCFLKKQYGNSSRKLNDILNDLTERIEKECEKEKK